MASYTVKFAAQQLGKFLVEEDRYLYPVSQKIESLQTELAWIECFLRKADTMQRQERVIGMWLSQVRDLAYSAEDILEKYLHHQQGGIQKNLKWFARIFSTPHYNLDKLGSDIDDLRVKITELSSKLQMYGIKVIEPKESLISDDISTRKVRRSVEEEVIFGLENDIKIVVGKLLAADVDLSVVSIVGTGGLGKSTLARRVFEDESIRQHFRNNCVWVNVSTNFNIRNAFEKILIGLSTSSITGSDKGVRKKDIKMLTLEKLCGDIGELLKAKRCLVVLDDIRTTRDWNSLQLALSPISCSDSKILLTRPNLNPPINAGPGYIHILKPLNDEEDWKLLQLRAFSWRDADLPSLEKLGREMLKHCYGVPLAITTLGGILSSKRSSLEWEEVLKKITATFMFREFIPIWELSFQNLPFYLQPCFLYLGIFPENFEISTEKLYHLWEIEGIIEGEGLLSLDMGERYLLELVTRSMVQVESRWPSGRIKTCRAPSAMRDFCIKKCMEISFLHIQEFTTLELATIFGKSSVVGTQVRRCALYEVEGYSSHSDELRKRAPYIRSLLVFPLNKSGTRDPKKNLKNIQKYFLLLRVLDLENTCTDITEVEFGLLIHLRYLGLRNVHVEKLPSSIWNLRYLVTLDLRSSCRVELPNKFQGMKRLRHLYLPREYVVTNEGKLRFTVQQFETLKNFDPEKCEMNDLSEMGSLRFFSIVKDYVFKDSDRLRKLVEHPVMKAGDCTNSMRLVINAVVFEQHASLLKSIDFSVHKLRLVGETSTSTLLPESDNIQVWHARRGAFPDSLTHLEILDCRLGLLIWPALGKLRQLRRLELHRTPTASKITFAAGSFRKLNFLSFTDCDKLVEWEVQEGALPNIQHLLLVKCSKLQKLPQGLPRFIDIECFPCINGIEEYNTCPHSNRSRAEAETHQLQASSSSSSAPVHQNM